MTRNKITRIIFGTILVLFMLVTAALPQLAFAQNKTTSQGPCKDINAKDPDGLGKCVVAIYNWALGISAILALLIIIFAGYLYISAGGNAQRVELAKEMFTGAMIGLIILIAAVAILQTINPELVQFKTPKKF
ncbi:MAG: hypothetical protein HY397_03090 [Candidatus Doudnabacteria bacterium]|nr:hypothetical protein [Candidatus Doudnabacteria bacterium]